MKRSCLLFLICATINLFNLAVIVNGTPPVVDMAEETVSLIPLYEKLELAVKDQGHRGSCEVFAMLDVLEFHLAKRGQKINVSEQFAMWAANKASHKYESGSRGFDPQDIVDGIKQYGIARDELMPYKATGGIGRPTKETLADAATRKNAALTLFLSTNREKREKATINTIKSICGSIKEENPVAIGAAWPHDGKLDQKGFLKEPGIKPGHAVVLVGYAVDKKYPGGGYFIFRNSWGKKYGENGYAKFTFKYFFDAVDEASAVRLY